MQSILKRWSPYSETEIWELEELLTIVKYEPYWRIKQFNLDVGLDAWPHGITLLEIKYIRLTERYGKGENLS